MIRRKSFSFVARRQPYSVCWACTRWATAFVLACAIGRIVDVPAAAQNFLTAAEPQSQRQSAPRAAWYNPFGWSNDPQAKAPPVKRQSAPVTAATATQATTAPADPQGSRFAKWNPFAWTNEPTRAKAVAPAQNTTQIATAQLPDDVSAAIATDGPLQPNSVLQASALHQNPLREASTPLRQPISWPVTTAATTPAADPGVVQTAHAAPTPVRQAAHVQNINPFTWSNAAPANYEEFGSQSVPLAGVADAAKQTLAWSNDPRGQARPQEFMPPEEKTFGAAFQESLAYVQPGGEAGRSELAASSPPPNLTDAEMIEWEKEHLPWTRPFYLSNDPAHEIAFHGGPEAPEADFSPLAQPFNWSNNPQQNAPQPPAPATTPARPMVAPDVSRDTRRVAYLQGEELLSPLPTATQGALDSPDPNAGIRGDGKGTLAEAEKIGEEPPESNTLQFLRADTVLLDPGQFQFDYGFSYLKFDTEFPIFVDTGMGVAVTDAEFHIREFQIPFEIRYGLARRVQLFVNMPFGWANTELTFPSYEEFENDGGLGDVTFGSTILLREHDQCKPDAILTLSSTAPTGNDPFSPSGSSPSAPSLGSGAWSLAANMLFIQNYDPVVVFYGFGTRQYFDTEIAGVDFSPGGEYNYQMGVGFAVNSTVTFSTRFNGAYITEAELANQRIKGSIQEPMTVTLAMTMAKCQKLIEPFVDFGITDDATDARIGITWTR